VANPIGPLSCAGPWFHRLGPSALAGAARPASVSLVCFPHAGGAAGTFFQLATRLAPDVAVYGVQYPGRQDRLDEPCVDDVVELAESITAELLKSRSTGVGAEARPERFALFGHSMGATVGYEVARRLEPAGLKPLALFASGRNAPALSGGRAESPTDDQALLAEIRELGGTDETVLEDPRYLPLIMPALRADYRAVRTYRHQAGPPLACPIVAVVGDADRRVSPDDARSWAAYTTGGFALRVLPGGHFYLAEQTDAVARLVADRLARVPAGARAEVV
jgi:pyochelin biosynthesis protein PchC